MNKSDIKCEFFVDKTCKECGHDLGTDECGEPAVAWSDNGSQTPSFACSKHVNADDGTWRPVSTIRRRGRGWQQLWADGTWRNFNLATPGQLKSYIEHPKDAEDKEFWLEVSKDPIYAGLL